MRQASKAALIAEAIWPGDAASRWLGMTLEEVRAGYARLSMRVTENMVNGQNVCHGGLIFALADSSFGYACNSHNQRALAAGASIDFLSPAVLGEVLVSECIENAKAGRRGIYDARVTNPKGETIALFRGESATVKGHWIE
ncbi:MAG TPA: hydroxyphenylacetyl-CoA thioesterase PaaI [Burkholderiales bacterium]